MRALVVALLLLGGQDKVKLTWNPPADKVLVAKVKGEISGKGSEAAFECHTELHSTTEAAKEGRVFTLRTLKLHSVSREKDATSEILFERGKDIVLKGRAAEETGPFKGMADDHVAIVSPLGLRKQDQVNDHIAETYALGIVEVQLSGEPVDIGSTWESELQIPFPGPDFTGKLKYTVEAIEKGKTVRIGIKPVEPGEEKLGWEGGGTMVYSFEDSLIREFHFELRRADKNVPIAASLKQDVTVALKP